MFPCWPPSKIARGMPKWAGNSMRVFSPTPSGIWTSPPSFGRSVVIGFTHHLVPQAPELGLGLRVGVPQAGIL